MKTAIAWKQPEEAYRRLRREGLKENAHVAAGAFLKPVLIGLVLVGFLRWRFGPWLPASFSWAAPLVVLLGGLIPWLCIFETPAGMRRVRIHRRGIDRQFWPSAGSFTVEGLRMAPGEEPQEVLRLHGSARTILSRVLPDDPRRRRAVLTRVERKLPRRDPRDVAAEAGALFGGYGRSAAWLAIGWGITWGVAAGWMAFQTGAWGGRTQLLLCVAAGLNPVLLLAEWVVRRPRRPGVASAVRVLGFVAAIWSILIAATVWLGFWFP